MRPPQRARRLGCGAPTWILFRGGRPSGQSWVEGGQIPAQSSCQSQGRSGAPTSGLPAQADHAPQPPARRAKHPGPGRVSPDPTSLAGGGGGAEPSCDRRAARGPGRGQGGPPRHSGASSWDPHPPISRGPRPWRNLWTPELVLGSAGTGNQGQLLRNRNSAAGPALRRSLLPSVCRGRQVPLARVQIGADEVGGPPAALPDHRGREWS